eukprot:Protomagalhaensia_sp_Gyna_25__4992@NODE_548_length_3158_cov_6_205515_g427_i0_p1_GENE_NODE_548_length_3158_cov_6_205515_g427_i0NODE_548_length_3158_cov_6_205515_g427_i0_p1_ORF_typecomplete_len350_score47_92_NODE_548_length_3158_cov_6_205515_g427_i011282177
MTAVSFFLGTSSGSVHVWRVATKDFVCVMPPPSPLGDPMPVVGLVFQALEAQATDTEVDVAFQALAAEASELGVEPPKPTRTRQLVWVFYGDGRGTLWEGDGCHRSALGLDGESYDSPDLPQFPASLRCADLSGPLAGYFPHIEPNLIATSELFRVLDIFDWSGPALAAALQRLGSEAASFPSALKLLTPITLRSSAVVLLLVAGKGPENPPHALMSLLPFTHQECPAVDFVPLGALGIREMPNRSFLCTRAELPVNGNLADAERRQDCLIIEHAGVVYAVLVETSREVVDPLHPPRVILSLMGSHILRARDTFTSIAYEGTFDELILGASSGKIICIPRLSQQLFPME